jgi:hypothetical protein
MHRWEHKSRGSEAPDLYLWNRWDSVITLSLYSYWLAVSMKNSNSSRIIKSLKFEWSPTSFNVSWMIKSLTFSVLWQQDKECSPVRYSNHSANLHGSNWTRELSQSWIFCESICLFLCLSLTVELALCVYLSIHLSLSVCLSVTAVSRADYFLCRSHRRRLTSSNLVFCLWYA